LKKFNKLDRFMPLNATTDKIVNADLVVQCGAPIYWCHDHVNAHCCENEWYEPLIKRRFIQNKKARFFNMAGGSCKTYFSDGSEFCPRCIAYIRELYDVSSLTTLRDALASDVLSQTGADAPLLPCTSLFAGDEFGIQPESGDYVVVNFMPLAGHYSFEKNIDKFRWQSVFKQVYESLKQSNRIVFVCHNEKEKKHAKQIDPSAKIFYAKNYIDYLNIYAGAKYGLVNRIHGAYALASFGKPSIVVGNDSRARMADEIGVERLYVNDVESQILLDAIDRMQRDASQFAEKSQSIKRDTLKKYEHLLESIL
jgi:hypothetical protein